MPYNYTIYPNYIGHFSQLEAELELDAYDALVDVKCYELVTLFLCSLFVPKCGSTGMVVPPCKYLCEGEQALMIRRISYVNGHSLHTLLFPQRQCGDASSFSVFSAWNYRSI